MIVVMVATWAPMHERQARAYFKELKRELKFSLSYFFTSIYIVSPVSMYIYLQSNLAS